MEIAIRADIDHHVVGIQAAAEARQDFVAPRARGQGYVDHLRALPAAPSRGHLVQFAKRTVRHRVEQGGRDIGGDVGGPQQVDALGGGVGGGRQILARPEPQLMARIHGVGVGFGMARQRGRQGFAGGVRVPAAVRLGGAGLRDFIPQPA